MKTKRFYITKKDNTQDALKKAIGIGLELAKESRLIIITATKKSEALEKLFGRKNINKINKSGRYGSVRVSLESLSTYEFAKKGDVVVAIYLLPKSFDSIDSFKEASYIIAVEFIDNELHEWKKRWNVVNLEDLESENEILELPCILKVALRDLSIMISGASMANPRANELAKTYILTFFKYKLDLNTADIKSCLISKHNWQPVDANDFIKLIEKKQNGSYFHGGDKTRLKNHYERWIKQCKEE